MVNVMKKHHGVAMLVAVLITLILFSILIIFVIALTWRNIRVQAWDAQRRSLQMLAVSTAISTLEGISNDVAISADINTVAATKAMAGDGISVSFDATDDTTVNIKLTGDGQNPQVTCLAQRKGTSSEKATVIAVLSGDKTNGRSIEWH
jgi:hypothetical protein